MARESPANQFRMAVSSWTHAILLVGTGLSSYVGASCINRALQLIPAGTAGVLRALDIPVSGLLGFVFLAERIASLQTFVGTVVILLASISLGYLRAGS